MRYFNKLFFGIILSVLILFIILLVIFIKKVRHGWIYLIAALLVLLFASYIQRQIVHATFYKFNREVCETYPEIEKVEYVSRYGGQIGSIGVYMKMEEEDERVERIFIDLMKKVNQAPLSEYLKQRGNSERLILEIYFYGTGNGSFRSEQYQRSDWFTDEQQKIQTWEEDHNHKKYRYSDYME